MKSLIFILGMIFLVTLAFAQSPAEEQSPAPKKLPYKVAILPVKIHSAENLGFMQEGLLDMLSSRVDLEGRVAVLEKGPVQKAYDQASGEMSVENAKKIGQLLEADFVVFGSLTKLGDSASLDLKVVGVKEENPGFSVFIQAKKMEEIIASVDQLGRQIDEKILGYPLKPQVAAKRAETEKEVKGIPSIPAIPVAPGPIRAKEAAGIGFWQSQPFPFLIKGMAVGDVDGDGRNEVVLISERKLHIYRWDGEFKRVWEREGGKLDNYMAVDVADIDKDGKAEIFVTNIQGDRLASFVVAFKDGSFRTVSSGLDWFLRVVEWGGKGKVLLGQYKGSTEGFIWPIYELGWDGKAYKEIRKADLPRIYSIYGFSPFIHGGNTQYLFIDSNFYLKALDQKGKMVWRGRDDYGSDNYFQAKPFYQAGGYQGTIYEDGDEYGYVNVRVITRGEEVFIIRNISAIGQILKRQKYYNKGVMQRLYWTGALFMETWKSPEISGYLADFQIQDVDNNREPDLIVAVNLPKEGMFSFEKNSALMVSRLQGVQ